MRERKLVGGSTATTIARQNSKTNNCSWFFEIVACKIETVLQDCVT